MELISVVVVFIIELAHENFQFFKGVKYYNCELIFILDTNEKIWVKLLIIWWQKYNSDIFMDSHFLCFVK